MIKLKCSSEKEQSPSAPSHLNSSVYGEKLWYNTSIIPRTVNQTVRIGVKALTDTNWEQSRPVVVLLADPYWGANEPESGVALVNHCVSITKVFPDHLPIYDQLWNTTVTGCRKNIQYRKHVNDYIAFSTRLWNSPVTKTKKRWHIL